MSFLLHALNLIHFTTFTVRLEDSYDGAKGDDCFGHQ